MTDSQDTSAPRAPGGRPQGRGRLPGHARLRHRPGQREREPGHRLAAAEDGGRPHTNQDWWPNQLDLSRAARSTRPQGNPLGAGLRLRRRSSTSSTSRRCKQRRRRGAQHLAGLVAGRLRPLRRPVHPDELARGRHLPDLGRPRWRRRRRPAVRAAQQLARQRQPRQGPPPAVAGQAEVRPEDLVGRPARLRRQRRAGGHGLRDLRLRLRPRGRLGARGDLLGSRGHLARRRALQRRPRARRARSARSRWA